MVVFGGKRESAKYAQSEWQKISRELKTDTSLEEFRSVAKGHNTQKTRKEMCPLLVCQLDGYIIGPDDLGWFFSTATPLTRHRWSGQ